MVPMLEATSASLFGVWNSLSNGAQERAMLREGGVERFWLRIVLTGAVAREGRPEAGVIDMRRIHSRSVHSAAAGSEIAAQCGGRTNSSVPWSRPACSPPNTR
jgi:hypothetical protein